MTRQNISADMICGGVLIGAYTGTVSDIAVVSKLLLLYNIYKKFNIMKMMKSSTGTFQVKAEDQIKKLWEILSGQ